MRSGNHTSTSRNFPVRGCFSDDGFLELCTTLAQNQQKGEIVKIARKTERKRKENSREKRRERKKRGYDDPGIS